MSFVTPTPTGGRPPVVVACSPASGQLFQVGTIPVQCTATDAATVTASCSFTVTVNAAPRLARTKFLAFGDSITAGEVTAPIVTTGAPEGGRGSILRQIVVPAASYPTQLSRRLSERYVAQSIVVTNAGRTGDYAIDAVSRFAATMTSTSPEVVLLVMGYNDLSLGGRVASQALAAVERMAKDARGRGARVFIGTLTPPIPGRLHSLPLDSVLSYNDGIRALAFGEGAVLVDLYDAVVTNTSQWIGIDGLHPTEAGYARIADVFFAAIQADLEVR